MTKFIKPVLMAFVAFIFTSCAAIHESVKASDPVNLTAVKIGMTKTEVQTALNKKPDNIVAAEHNSETNTTVEVVQYSQWGSVGTGADAVAKRMDSYWLYFVNDKLDKWHQIRPEDKRPMDFRSGGR